MGRIYLSAAHKSSGKTTVSIGLCAALRARGLAVAPFKKGPDYIDPMWLGTAAGRPCYNLDFHTQGHDAILATLTGGSGGADLALIEGNKGLFDGMDLEGGDSNAALARLLDAAVVLVIDCEGMTRGLAPLLLGYLGFEPAPRIAGVILNRVAGPRHEGKLRAVVERYTDLPVIGALHRHGDLRLEERHLGLTPSNEDRRAAAKIAAIARRVAGQVDLDALLSLAAEAPALPAAPPAAPALPAPDLRIAIARDAAFGFYYPDDLDALRRAGAELVPFDALADPDLPDADGLFIGGGFPETQLEALAANRPLRAAVRAAIEAGLPAYAECGGLMYLARGIRWGERYGEMVGVIPADVVMHQRPQGRGYVRLRETGESPWPGGTGTEIPAHEFHYSRLEALPPGTRFAYTMARGTGVDGAHDGIVHHNLLASYSHLRDTGGHHWAARFVEFVRRCKDGRSAAPPGH